jgi:hypothetical protein
MSINKTNPKELKSSMGIPSELKLKLLTDE